MLNFQTLTKLHLNHIQFDKLASPNLLSFPIIFFEQVLWCFYQENSFGFEQINNPFYRLRTSEIFEIVN